MQEARNEKQVAIKKAAPLPANDRGRLSTGLRQLVENPGNSDTPKKM